MSSSHRARTRRGSSKSGIGASSRNVDDATRNHPTNRNNRVRFEPAQQSSKNLSFGSALNILPSFQRAVNHPANSGTQFVGWADGVFPSQEFEVYDARTQLYTRDVSCSPYVTSYGELFPIQTVGETHAKYQPFIQGGPLDHSRNPSVFQDLKANPTKCVQFKAAKVQPSAKASFVQASIVKTKSSHGSELHGATDIPDWAAWDIGVKPQLYTKDKSSGRISKSLEGGTKIAAAHATDRNINHNQLIYKGHMFARKQTPIGVRCNICKIDLGSTPTESTTYHHQDPPVTAVLPCGHCFHFTCLQQIGSLEELSGDPSCFICN